MQFSSVQSYQLKNGRENSNGDEKFQQPIRIESASESIFVQEKEEDRKGYGTTNIEEQLCAAFVDNGSALATICKTAAAVPLTI